MFMLIVIFSLLMALQLNSSEQREYMIAPDAVSFNGKNEITLCFIIREMKEIP